MTSTRSVLLIVLVCLVVACFAALMFLDRTGAGDRSHADLVGGSSVPASPPVLGAMDDHLARDLLAEVRGLRADLSELTRASTARAPAAKANGDADLLAAMKDLTTALRERTSVGSGGVARAAVVQPASSTGFSDLDALLNAKSADVRGQHDFWTLQQVLDRYGMPGSMNVHEGVLKLNYFLGPEGKQRWCGFQLFDGLVIGVSTNS